MKSASPKSSILSWNFLKLCNNKFRVLFIYGNLLIFYTVKFSGWSPPYFCGNWSRSATWLNNFARRVSSEPRNVIFECVSSDLMGFKSRQSVAKSGISVANSSTYLLMHILYYYLQDIKLELLLVKITEAKNSERLS